MTARIVDTHVHLWDPAQGYEWLRGELRRPFTVDDLRAEVSAHGEDVAIVIIEADRGKGIVETREHLDLAARHRMIAGVVGDLPDDADVSGLAHLPNGERLLGIRTSGRRFHALDNRTRRRVAAALADRGLVWEFNVDADQLEDVIQIARSERDIPVVLDHLAGCPGRDQPHWRNWQRAVDDLAALPNVNIKVSGVGTRPPRLVDAAIDHLTKLFGPDRLPVGSDWPISTMACAWAESLDRAIATLTASSDDAPRPLDAACRAYPRLAGALDPGPAP